MVLYRKYRPQQLSELDNEDVRKRLTAILSSDYIPHAFLFAGSKGTGKTSSARIVAKILNCEKSGIRDQRSGNSKKKLTPDNRPLTTDIEPCNICETCISITEGRNMDVLELDAASNRGIDEVRTLRENIRLSPISARRKVYIIDEVHMLTTEAFNALLKTLEEPPKHAVFILATTDPEKLPETVRSRTHVLHFAKATKEDIMHSLSRVVLGEHLTVSESVLGKIAGAADGSFRDATKLFEQVIAEGALGGLGISKIVGSEGLELFVFLDLLAQKDAATLLKAVVRATSAGIDYRLFVSDVLRSLHGYLLHLHGITSEDDAELSTSDFAKSDVLALIKLFSRVYSELKFASSPNIPVEVAIVEWCDRDIKN